MEVSGGNNYQLSHVRKAAQRREGKKPVVECPPDVLETAQNTIAAHDAGDAPPLLQPTELSPGNVGAPVVGPKVESI